MAINARTKRYTTVSDIEWLPVGSSSGVRRLFSMQVATSSSPLYVYIGPGTPNKADAMILSALDWWEFDVASVIGPVYILPATGGIASVVVLER